MLDLAFPRSLTVSPSANSLVSALLEDYIRRVETDAKWPSFLWSLLSHLFLDVQDRSVEPEYKTRERLRECFSANDQMKDYNTVQLSESPSGYCTSTDHTSDGMNPQEENASNLLSSFRCHGLRRNTLTARARYGLRFFTFGSSRDSLPAIPSRSGSRVRCNGPKTTKAEAARG